MKDAVGSDSDSDGLDAVDTLIIDLASAHVGDDNDAKAAALARLPQSRKTHSSSSTPPASSKC